MVERLTLTAFRCYDRLRLDVGPRPMVLTGPNGAGKTNLLEALSFLAPGRGLRRAALADPCRRAGGGVGGDAATAGAPWAVAAHLRLPAGPGTLGRGVDVGTGLERATAGERRLVRIDGATAGQAALGDLFSVLWLTPEMDGLFRGAASERRRFLDRLVNGLDPDHAGRTAAYAQAQRERARLLREGRASRGWLDGLEDVMARHGVAIVAARRDLVDRLGAAVRGATGPFPGARIDLVSEVDGWLAAGPALAAEDRLRAALATARGPEAPAPGPHRDDLAVRHGPKDIPAVQASTGEQKAVLIALILAQARVQEAARAVAPLLLLDEGVAHLDAPRRAALGEALSGQGLQAWVSGTEAQAFDSWAKNAQFLRIAEGVVLD
ncbi:DNA replication/repair protein RecF [Rhodospirillum rubrum]|uniref:DNA replication/repair protein RecF n=1 Tax=Rhodospirillum rubrum TaxID=1085 RepID=UPI001903F34F|nr:DNA replication/repair protein RecF [Rhodospirillum rubrum]MBK1664989.1 DNA replication/repair protein RecF [Rhodospirillum rubrum]MBK1677266.1 DNA replication/repair protein RecF [Rhodospirillum rubrum]